jgi:type IV secretion system protein VirD4
MGREFHYKTEKHVDDCRLHPLRQGPGFACPEPADAYPHSAFVLDPKGENCRKTAECREGRGGRIAAFDVENLTGRPSARFNPIAAMLKGDMVTRADYLAEALVVGKDDHWNNSARSLIRMLALHICTAPEDMLGGRARDLVTLRELLTGLLDVTVKDYMPQNGAIDGLIARLAESFASIPDNERGSIVSTATQATRWLDNPALAALFKAGEDCIDFEALRDETKSLSIFVCLPAMVFATYPQIARLLTTFALDTMMRKETGRRRPVMFILDELAQLERLPIVERAFTLGAGYGVQVWAVFQSVEQVRKLYALDSLYGSSGFRGFFKLEDPESCEFASKCASGLYSPAAVRHMPEFGMLTLLDGANPLYVERLGARLAKQASERKAA